MSADSRAVRGNPLLWVALVTCTLLSIPLIAMRFTDAVAWDAADFLVMGVLLFGTGSALMVIRSRWRGSRRVLMAAVVMVAALVVWAELAVGVVTSLGS